jgi:hypothetical protein
MFDFTAINWWAVLVSMVVTVFISSFWFGPKLFFNIWWRGIGKTESDKPGAGSNMGVVFGLTFLASFVQPLFLAVLMHALYPDGASIGEGIATALFVGVGFVAASSLGNKLFAGFRSSVWWLETGNHLLTYVVVGIILSLWQ